MAGVSEFTETVSQALDHEKAAQRIAGWWFQTPEARHQMLQHLKQAMMIWELAGIFPEQAERCRQMMLLHDGEGGGGGEDEDEDDGEHGGSEESKYEVAVAATAAAERARYLAQYEQFLRREPLPRAPPHHLHRKRRHQQQQLQPPHPHQEEEKEGAQPQNRIYDFFPPEVSSGSHPPAFVGLSQ